jgi:hypothetical protein
MEGEINYNYNYNYSYWGNPQKNQSVSQPRFEQVICLDHHNLVATNVLYTVYRNQMPVISEHQSQ